MGEWSLEVVASRRSKILTGDDRGGLNEKQVCPNREQ